MDKTKKPLRIPPSFSVYAEEHGLFDMFKRLMCEIIVDKPTDPLTYTINWLEQDNSQVPKIAVVGPPGCGKTSVSRSLCKSIKTVLVDEKELLADELSEYVLQALECIENAEEVPDDIWVRLIIIRLSEVDCQRRGFVLEGFPRNRAQAIALQSQGILLEHVVCLHAPPMVLIERQSGKRIDPLTDDVYHTTFDWPEDEDVQDRLVPMKDNPYGVDCLEGRMQDYERNIDGVLVSYPENHKKINADQPKTDVLNQTYSFVNVQHRTNAPHTPRVVLIGPVGCGKSTLAQKLAQKYQIVDVDCGQLIKQHIAGETKLGILAKTCIDKDQRVENNIVIKMITARLSQLDASVRGWVIHGFPLTSRQAELLTDAGYRANRVYILDMPSDSIIERLSYRLLDPITGQRYHQLYDPPQSYKIKARCVKHPKDMECSIRKRLDEYYSSNQELLSYYEDYKPIHVNADQDHHTVMEYVESTIVNPLPTDLKQDDI